MKKQEKTTKNEQQTEKRVGGFTMSVNSCIACGKEIPEGMLVCMECEIGRSEKRCTICDRPIAEGEAICSHCKVVIFCSKNKKK